MTKSELMKLAEFPEDIYPQEFDEAREGLSYGYSRLLPLIEALAESNEILIEALEAIAAPDFKLDRFERMGQEDLLDQVVEDTQAARKALADHAKWMEKLRG